MDHRLLHVGVVSLAFSVVVCCGAALPSAFTVAAGDSHRVGPLLAVVGNNPRSDGTFDGNPLAGDCTATLEAFQAVYGNRKGFQHFIGTQVGEFTDCLNGAVEADAAAGAAASAAGPPAQASNRIAPDMSKKDRVKLARESVAKAQEARQKRDAAIERHRDAQGPSSDADGAPGSSKKSGGNLRGEQANGGSSGRQKGGRGRHGGRGAGRGGRGGGGAQSNFDRTAVPDRIVSDVKARIDSFNRSKSKSEYFGIHAWQVEAAEREVAGAGFNETLFGVALKVEDTAFSEQLELQAGAESGFQPLSFARIIGRRAHRIRCSEIHGQYNQWFQSPSIWDTLNRAVKYRPGDIVVSTYPKAGTTWTEQIVLLLLAGGDESKVSSRRRHMPSFTEKYMLDPQNFFKLWFERDLGKFHQSQEITQQRLNLMNKIPGRRVIKTHAYRRTLFGNNIFVAGSDSGDVSQSLELDPNLKIIYVARNPKDQAMSMFHQEFHFGTLENEVPWPLDAWLRAWFDGVTVYGSWFVSLKGWFEALEKDTRNQLLFLKYEDMIHDHSGAVRKIADHLGLDATDDLVDAVVEKSSMEHIKDELKGKGSKAVIYRKGGIGDWRNTFSPELSAEFDAMWTAEMRKRGLCGRSRPELEFDIGDGEVLKC
eukprot:INCI17659.5.p1 GENE.INCI17659.5~~INCI17659.5.p1  ORF type:complete len:650 (-),score=98.56 INCI17659.5:659-2608(-)